MHADDDLWAFSLRVYRQAGVADACLGLQDRLAADVNLLLFAAWIGAGGRRLDAQEARSAVNAVIQWHGEVVEELRRVRRRLKAGPVPAPNPQTETLREAVKACELAAEKVEQDILQNLQRSRPGPGSPEDAVTAAAANVVSVLGMTAKMPPGETEAGLVSTIVQAALPSATHVAVEAAVRQQILALRESGPNTLDIRS